MVLAAGAGSSCPAALAKLKIMTYQEIIIAATGCAPADAPEIERIMRDRFVFGSELDGKSAKQLVWGARYENLHLCRRIANGPNPIERK